MTDRSDIIQCQCGKKYRMRPELAGKRFKCKKCGKPVAIPGAEVEYAEVLEDDDEVDGDLEDYLVDDDTPLPVFRVRKSRSRRRASNEALKSASRVAVPAMRMLVRGTMTVVGSIAILAYIVAFFCGYFVAAIPGLMLSILGMAGINGKGIPISRDFTLEGDWALVLGSILIVLSACLPIVFWVIIAIYAGPLQPR